MQENLQGIRDNLTKVADLLEAGKGAPIQIHGHMSSIISLQLDERFQRIMLKQNPNGFDCDGNDPENQDCMPIPYKELALNTLLDIAKEYQGYGYFSDADRVLNEIENLSEEGRAKVAELRPVYQEVRKTYVRAKEEADELSIMLPSGEPKPIKIHALEAIEENHKAAIAAYNKAHASSSSVASVSSSSVNTQNSSAAAKDQLSVNTDTKNTRYFIFIALAVLLLVFGAISIFRKK